MTMESSPLVPNKSKESPRKNSHEIVGVHSPLTARMMPKKFDVLNQHRPVLHQYTPEQVEIVYHRRSGAEEVKQGKCTTNSEVVKTASKRNKRKEVTNTSLKAETENENDQNGDLSISSDQFSQSETVYGDSQKGTSSFLNFTREGDEHGSRRNLDDSEITIGTSTRQSPFQYDISVEAAFTNKLKELTDLVGTLATNVSTMEVKMKTLEEINSATASECKSLRSQLVHHLQANTVIAHEMRRLKVATATKGMAVKNQEIETLLERARKNKKFADSNRKTLGDKENLEDTATSNKILSMNYDGTGTNVPTLEEH